MAKKVLYIGFVPFTERLRQDWFIDALIGEGVAVEYWNLSSFLDGIAHDEHRADADYVREFNCYTDFEGALSLPENREAFAVMLMGYGERFIPIYRLLSKYNCQMAYIAWGVLPERHHLKTTLRTLYMAGPHKIVHRLYNKAKSLVFLQLGLVKPYTVVFAAGLFLASRFDQADRTVPINAFDYDKFYLAAKSNDVGAAGEYAVFLDIYLPKQSDILFDRVKAVNEGRYYASLNRFFGFVEQKYGIRVVIAAHPKSNYSPGIFAGREIHRNKTAELVRNCRFTISHHSTSINYAVLSRVPVLFIYTQEMLELYARNRVASIKDIATYLKANVYNIDSLAGPDDIELNPVDPACYNEFIYAFLTSPGTENLTTKEIYIRTVQSYLAERVA